MNTILIVTQERHIAQAMADLIQVVAAEVRSDRSRVFPACSPDEVLQVFAMCPVDILIVDHRLAGMTGIELIRWLGNGLTGTVKILLTDDSRMLADPWTFAGPHVNGVLARPLGRAALKQTLDRWLHPSTTPAPRSDGRTTTRVNTPL